MDVNGMLRWSDDGTVVRAFRGGGIVFCDSRDHIINAVYRLLGVTETDFRAFVERATRTLPLQDLEEPELIGVLRDAAFALGTAPPLDPPLDLTTRSVKSGLGNQADEIVAAAIYERDDVLIVGSRSDRIGWLVERSTLTAPAVPLVKYEDSYFEGGNAKVGYGKYFEQQAWRLEKASRYVGRIRATFALSEISFAVRPRLLDVGSGYGFFRKAAADVGWKHDGLEVSSHAARAAREVFGFETFVGSLDKLSTGAISGTYDIVTMWDVIEHLVDPISALKLVAEHLRPGGVVFVRTPNVEAFERDIFGWRYHSFKLEHLYYFSALSLTRLLEKAGFAILSLSSDSHLLSGLIGNRVGGLAALLRGSDFFVAARRT